MNSQFWWFVARASGMVAAVLLIATLIWGLLITTHLIDRRGMPAWLTDLHRGLGGLSVIFIGVHLLSLVADSYLHFSWAELFVPFASAYKAGAVAWGVAAFWGLVLVEGSSLVVKRRTKGSLWRRIHYVSFPIGVLVGLHAFQAGTDAGNSVFRVVAVTMFGLTAALIVFRMAGGRAKPQRVTPSRPTRQPVSLPTTPPLQTMPTVVRIPVPVPPHNGPPPVPEWLAAGPPSQPPDHAPRDSPRR